MAKKQSKVVDLKGKPRQEAEKMTQQPEPEQKTIEQLGLETAAEVLKANVDRDANHVMLERLCIIQVLGEQLLAAFAGMGGHLHQLDSMMEFTMQRSGRVVKGKDGAQAFATTYEEWRKGWEKFKASLNQQANTPAAGGKENDGKTSDGQERGEGPEKA